MPFNALTNQMEPDYEDKISLLSAEDFFALFESLDADPYWVTSNGKRAIQILGLCHCGSHHSALFDPTTHKVNCFADCGGGMMLHTWVMRALHLPYAQAAKDTVEDWIDGHGIDLSDCQPRTGDEYDYIEKPYEPTHIEPVPGIPQEIIDRLYAQWDRSEETLSRLVWHTEDGIDVEQLKRFDVAFCPAIPGSSPGRVKRMGTIILPHHNADGQIVGLYERSFDYTRREAKDVFKLDLQDDGDRKFQMTFPRAKYVPLLRPEWDANKTLSSYSFPNSRNLYGLHMAKDAIQQTGKAIIFEGAKSVMLAHQYGYPFSVASHTFGAHVNHISLLLEYGAKEIILAFDRQYKEVSNDSFEWPFYEQKSQELVKQVGKYVKVSRIVDKGNLLQYKDAPIDRGKDVFESLYSKREVLTM